MTTKIRTGVIGLGKMGIFHSALINMIHTAELVAVHDRNQKLAKYVKNAGLDVRFYVDLDQMMREADLHSVFICTPPSTHYPLARECVSKNLDVFIEKPLADSFSSGQKMLALLDGKNIIHATGFTAAHIPILKKAKEILTHSVLGELYRFNISVYISQVFSKKKAWFFDKSQSGGGVIIDIASHLLYLVVWYFGLPSRVFARLHSFYSDVEDAGTILMDYEQGLTGALDTSWSLPGYRMATHEISIEGEHGFIEITNDYIKLNLRKSSGNYGEGWTTIYKADMTSSSQFDLGSEGFFDEDSHFFSCCLSRERPIVTWEEWLKVQQMIDLIYRSDEQNKALTLTLG